MSGNEQLQISSPPNKGKAESIKNDFRSNMKNNGHTDKKYLIFVCPTLNKS